MPLNFFLPQVTRIPVAGPDPYNTLVNVVVQINGGPKWVKDGKLNRWSTTVTTPFVLAGFDQRVPPNFQHSTTAFLSSIGPEEDSNWVFAVDGVSGAGFDTKDGTYFVNIDVAMNPGDAAPGQCTTYGYVDENNPGYQVCDFYMTIQITSFVLCYEPPPPNQPAGRAGSRSFQRIAERVPASFAEALAHMRGMPVSVAAPPGACDCSVPRGKRG